MSFRLWFYRLFRKHFACWMGYHGRRFGPDGEPANFCEWGCGHAFNTDAFKTWSVTLRTGEQFEVQATNEYHAGSLVVYGQCTRIDGRTQAAMGSIKVHRSNIVSALQKV